MSTEVSKQLEPEWKLTHNCRNENKQEISKSLPTLFKIFPSRKMEWSLHFIANHVCCEREGEGCRKVRGKHSSTTRGHETEAQAGLGWGEGRKPHAGHLNSKAEQVAIQCQRHGVWPLCLTAWCEVSQGHHRATLRSVSSTLTTKSHYLGVPCSQRSHRASRKEVRYGSKLTPFSCVSASFGTDTVGIFPFLASQSLNLDFGSWCN